MALRYYLTGILPHYRTFESQKENLTDCSDYIKIYICTKLLGLLPSQA